MEWVFVSNTMRLHLNILFWSVTKWAKTKRRA